MGFFGLCIAWCCELARGCDWGEPESCLSLAAAIYITLEHLFAEMGEAEIQALRMRPTVKLSEIPAALEALRWVAAPEMAQVLLPCLLGLDAAFFEIAQFDAMKAQVLDIRVAGRPAPQDIFNQGHRIPDKVSCAVIPRSSLHAQRAVRERDGALKGPPPRPLHPADDLQQLRFDWQRDPLDAGWVADIRGRIGSTADWWDGCGTRHCGAEGFRLALSWLPPGKAQFATRFQLVQDGHGVRTSLATPVDGESALVARTREVLEASRAVGASIVLLPELSISEPVLDQVRAWMMVNRRSAYPFFKVVAGSFHVGANPEAPPNRAPVLRRDAGPLFHADKRGRFCLSEAEVRGAHQMGLLDNPLPAQLPERTWEHIQPGNTLLSWVLPVAQMSVLICADLLDDAPVSLRSLLLRVRPDLVLCPAYTPETSAFERAADALFPHGIGVVMVNDYRRCKEGELLALVSLPLREHPDRPPVRVGWRKGDDGPVRWSFQRKGWEKCEDSSVAALGDGLGMVVNLSPHLKAYEPLSS